MHLLEEGLAFGVRIGELPVSSMRAIQVVHVRRVVCAAPEDLTQYRMLHEPQDLVPHRVICAIPVSPANEWRFGTGKMLESVKIHPRLTVTNNDAAIQAALQGLGVTRLMSYQIAAHLAAGRLTRVLADYEPPPLPIHVLHREGRQASAKVRSFVDLLVERLRADIALS